MTSGLILPFSYNVACVITACSAIWGLANLKKKWSIPFLTVLGTFAGWYLLEPIYTPETLKKFNVETIESVYWSATLFIVSFIALYIVFTPVLRPNKSKQRFAFKGDEKNGGINSHSVRYLIKYLFALWSVLLLIGIYRLNGDVLQALFPVGGRFSQSMWMRAGGSGAGLTGFLVSTANYLYIMALAGFGFLLPLTRRSSEQLFLSVLILVSWPYVFMLGTRSSVLTVVLPLFAAIFIFGKLGNITKMIIVAVGYFLIDTLFRINIASRATGFTIDGGEAEVHEGLNMASELAWITHFLDRGVMQISWGGRYFADLVNIVPRAIWPGKPLIGIDYAIARGFGTNLTDTGVSATISTGLIGQGVVNFGLVFGPIVAAALMAVWANVLLRLRLQNTTPRLALFCLGLAVTFNLGRDISLLVLFPFVFGYLAVLFFEKKVGYLKVDLPARHK